MIRGGAEYDLGIYITGVDQGSAADFGGLKVGLLNLSHGYFWAWLHLGLSLFLWKIQDWEKFCVRIFGILPDRVYIRIFDTGNSLSEVPGHQ